jgi:septum formation topological specificity factor MinE
MFYSVRQLLEAKNVKSPVWVWGILRSSENGEYFIEDVKNKKYRLMFQNVKPGTKVMFDVLKGSIVGINYDPIKNEIRLVRNPTIEGNNLYFEVNGEYIEINLEEYGVSPEEINKEDTAREEEINIDYGERFEEKIIVDDEEEEDDEEVEEEIEQYYNALENLEESSKNGEESVRISKKLENSIEELKDYVEETLEKVQKSVNTNEEIKNILQKIVNDSGEDWKKETSEIVRKETIAALKKFAKVEIEPIKVDTEEILTFVKKNEGNLLLIKPIAALLVMLVILNFTLFILLLVKIGKG